MLGGIGHALVPAVEEAIFFHGIARASQPDFRVKGNNPLTEHYSILGPEVVDDQRGNAIGEKNRPLIEKLLSFDAVLIAGQAKSHCVAWTIDDLLTGITPSTVAWSRRSICWRTAPPLSWSPASSTGPRTPMPRSSASPPRACTSSGPASRSTRWLEPLAARV